MSGLCRKEEKYPHEINEAERPYARALWEQIFPEDTAAFLDTFEALRQDRRILAVKGAEGLLSMIQLDRGSLFFGGRRIAADYLVGVSTLPEYRHRGLMRTLLEEAIRNGALRHDPFIYLMPANEAVYLPFGFRTVYAQSVYEAPASPAGPPALQGRIAAAKDAEALAELASHILAETCDVYCVRDASYFRDLIREMACENGLVSFLYEASGSPSYTDTASPCADASGYICFWPAAGSAAQTALPQAGAQVREIVTADPEGTAALLGLVPASEPPVIMIRLLDPAEAVRPLRAAHKTSFILDYSDDILDMYSGLWLLTTGPDGASLERACGKIPALPVLKLTAEELAEWIFGALEIPGTEGIERPGRILLNEWI